MGRPTATARRGANGEVEYDVRSSMPRGDGTEGGVSVNNLVNKRTDEAKEAALNELYARETAEVQARTAQLGGVSGGGVGGQARINTNAVASSRAVAGNPGMADNRASGEVDLSTADNTERRRRGYRRDDGIRI